RPVKAQTHADALDVGRCSLVAGDYRRRVSGRDIEQAEHEQRYHHHHWNGGEDAPYDVPQHAAMLAGFMPACRCSSPETQRQPAVCLFAADSAAPHADLVPPQKKGNGTFTKPPTLLRQA